MSNTQEVKLNATVSYACAKCHQVTKISFNGEDWLRWQEGEYIQEAMPYLTTDERELMISSVCGTCFDAMFADCE
jgi:hypothetical protein